MKKIVRFNPQATAAIWDLLPDIDKILNANGLALSSRTTAAIEILLKHFVKVIGAPTEPPFEQKWYAILYAIVLQWYEARYGSALRAKIGALLGVVEIHHIPFKVTIETTHIQPHPSGEHLTLVVGPKLGNNERPRDWITSPPTLSALTANESSRLDRDLSKLVKQLRLIHINFDLADPAPKNFDEHRNVALLAIRKAAEHIANRTEGDYASAVWEIHFSIENTIKALIAQTGTRPESEHKLSILITQASSVGITLDLENTLGFLPSSSRAIAHRYGRPLPNGYRDAITIYNKALPLLVNLSSQVHRSFDFTDDAAFILRRPPWLEFMEK